MCNSDFRRYVRYAWPGEMSLSQTIPQPLHCIQSTTRPFVWVVVLPILFQLCGFNVWEHTPSPDPKWANIMGIPKCDLTLRSSHQYGGNQQRQTSGSGGRSAYWAGTALQGDGL